MSKIFLITGDRKGIGRSLTEYYLDKGNIVIGCSRSGSNLIHKNYEHFICDVGDEESVKKVTSAIRKKHRSALSWLLFTVASSVLLLLCGRTRRFSSRS